MYNQCYAVLPSADPVPVPFSASARVLGTVSHPGGCPLKVKHVESEDNSTLIPIQIDFGEDNSDRKISEAEDSQPFLKTVDISQEIFNFRYNFHSILLKFSTVMCAEVACQSGVR
jgi:hypothetical protein